MKGNLIHRLGGYFVLHIVNAGNIPIQQKRIPVYPKDQPDPSLIGTSVEFELIDEFTHPEFYQDIAFMDGIKYAKLKQ
jgi:hypothetical protein